MILWLAACVAKVPILSTPPGVELSIGAEDQARLTTTPATVTVGWRCVPVRANSLGHRTLALEVCRRDRGGVELVLVTEHGPAGTWSADSVP
ncbi:MAG: hypothetical protein ABMA64_29235 [Myxococcota bacterium]